MDGISKNGGPTTLLVQRTLSGPFDVTIIIMMSKSKNSEISCRKFYENRLVVVLILQNENKTILINFTDFDWNWFIMWNEF